MYDFSNLQKTSSSSGGEDTDDHRGGRVGEGERFYSVARIREEQMVSNHRPCFILLFFISTSFGLTKILVLEDRQGKCIICKAMNEKWNKKKDNSHFYIGFG